MGISKTVAERKRFQDKRERELGLIPYSEGVVPLSSVSALMSYARDAHAHIKSDGRGNLWFRAHGVKFTAIEPEVSFR